jgi:hypothetical protein
MAIRNEDTICPVTIIQAISGPDNEGDYTISAGRRLISLSPETSKGADLAGMKVGDPVILVPAGAVVDQAFEVARYRYDGIGVILPQVIRSADTKIGDHGRGVFAVVDRKDGSRPNFFMVGDDAAVELGAHRPEENDLDLDYADGALPSAA